MKLLPFDNILYKTILTEADVIKRLADVTAAETMFSLNIFECRSSKTYKGKIDNLAFKIHRITCYQNSFRPIINGVIEPADEGVIIKVKMRLHFFVLVFLLIFATGIGFSNVLKSVFVDLKLEWNSLIPLGISVIAYLVILGAYKLESRKSKKDLQKIFNAEIIDH